MKISKQLCGIAGEYYVAAEISRRGYLAAITLRNTDGIDILVSNIHGDKSISIQVKTTQNKKKWILSKKVENDIAENKYYVFVQIPDDVNCQPNYYIVSAVILSSNIYDGHKRWLNSSGKNGKIRNDSNVRQFDPRYFNTDEIIENWDALFKLLN